ncbi:MAG: alpha-ribazole kinase [Desulfobacteraceae bacterium]|nr:alpha-ribazole kinase [Desulfobacteraceae bacterium]
MGYAGRDIEVVFMENGWCLVVACDSCGAVGDKELDVVTVPPYLVGRLTSRVALLEVISSGADPRVVSVSVSAEPEPTGEGILQGVRDELAACCGKQIPLAISTEKNFPTRQTGLGISVSGTCPADRLRLEKSRSGDRLYCLGLPKVGNELNDPDDPEIINGSFIRRLLGHPSVHDVLPVGSQGIRKEAERLASSVRSSIRFEKQAIPDLDKSAGPATCALFTSSSPCEAGDFGSLPLFPIGILTQ